MHIVISDVIFISIKLLLLAVQSAFVNLVHIIIVIL